MFWIFLAFGSAVFLGFYDICKKKAVSGNAVWPVLWICSVTNVLLLLPFIAFSEWPSIGDHLTLIVKAILVTISWAFTYHAIAQLPLSVSAPIRASAPVFTIFMATCFMGERPALLEWTGIAFCLAGYFCFGISGKRETGSYWKNKFVLLMFLGTFFGSCSGVYDKFLLQHLKYDPLILQFWFNVYMSLIQGVFVFGYWFPRRATQPFYFKPAVFLVGVLLIVADRFYFLSLHEEEALVSIVTVIRRSNVLISFVAGLLLFKESKNIYKWIALFGFGNL